MNIEEIAVLLDSAKNLSVVTIFTDKGTAKVTLNIDTKQLEFELSDMPDIQALYVAENEFKSHHTDIKNYAIDTILRIVKNKTINNLTDKKAK